jgi:hypothetical protein
MPLTSPHGVLLVKGLPVAPVSTSGYTAQPSAGSKLKASALPGSIRTSLPAATASALFLDGSVMVKLPAGSASTRQSESGLAPSAGSTVFSPLAAMKSRSRP